MGSGPSYTIQDYGDRVMAYILEKGEASTEDIFDEVRGTNHRVMEGLILLAFSNRIKAQVSKHKITWVPK